MRAYAVVYRFTDTKAGLSFKEAIQKTFRDVREEETPKLHYMGFTGRKEPEVEDKIAGILSNIRHHSTLEDADYVAVYFSPEHDSDEIIRRMAFGKDDTIERDVTPNYRPQHISIITDLLEFDPVRH